MSDPAALDRLYRAERPRLLAWLLRRVGCPATAADLAQDSFLRLLARGGTAGLTDPTAWLARTARNLATDADRRAALRQPADFLVLEGLTDPHPSPETAADAAQRARTLGVLIAALPPRQREVLLLARLEGLSHAEIGARLGISPNTAMVHLGRALAILARLRAE